MRPSILFAFFATAKAVLLPNPSGPYPVAVQVHSLTDNGRVDPYSPKNNRHKRKLVTSIFWPVHDSASCSTVQTPYMPPATAELYGVQAASMGLSNDTFSKLRLEVCDVVKVKGCSGHKKVHRYPVAVFSPGSGNSRLLYSAMARSLASYGYIVVIVDHPYDADIVEFPDGMIIESANIPEETGPLEKLTQIRAEDITFVISQLQNNSSRFPPPGGLPSRMDFSKITVFGHSLGGASAAAALMSNSNLRGGVNLDGRLIEPALSKGLQKPFFLLGRPGHSAEDATWYQFWKRLRGPKVEAEVSGTVHGSFTDLPLVISALGLPDDARSQLEPMIGTIKAKRLSMVLAETLLSSFASVFEHSSAPLLSTIKALPEVSITKSRLR